LLGHSRRHNQSKGFIDMLAISGFALLSRFPLTLPRATKGIKVQDDTAMKAMLHRIVEMLTRMAMKFDGVAEPDAEYVAEIDCDNEHRCAEHEHEAQTEELPEPWDATERRW
jgi:hypothetical protein